MATYTESFNFASCDSSTREIEFTVTLRRNEGGLGLRICGGIEEASQVTVDFIVPGGAADLDGRVRVGDVITSCNGVNVINAPHRKVVRLMRNPGPSGVVSLRIRRIVSSHAGTNDFLAPADKK